MTTTKTTDFDVLVVGAGISGIGAAYHLKTFRPATTFAVLEGRDSIGGTWNLHQYPGIRSDSDMPTFGYGFKPWTHRKAIADGHIILDYLQQTLDEFDLGQHIRFGYKVQSANFDTTQGRWTLTATDPATSETTTFTSRFCFWGRDTTTTTSPSPRSSPAGKTSRAPSSTRSTGPSTSTTRASVSS